MAPWSLTWAQPQLVSPPPTRSGTGQTPALATVTGTVFDSISQTPRSDALVQMQPLTDSGASALKALYTATSDSVGRYRIENVPHGQYIAAVFHPALEFRRARSQTERSTP